ncbi:FAD dependent oxidoreductase [Granulibacter bethesdensis]|uniref:FAD dependent oxidoreductase n=1 Tax=Granulibacter bethesdensis TaxID=364410 RepID=A0AAC9KC14_9PROT|nr:NAD(P)/FAD-dependent oxidoreductase [Granulibacter bethesdensis]APH55604.1 FAD dependent oxidoreductase [Granulibacter bethesdensis]APH63189.1 FAD dependent oxidoreductase [Granulibacter bethesdensis]
MARVAVVGAGAMGLAAAYHAVKAGHDVTVYEADAVPGGMAAHFDFGGLSLERYYHFVCKSDQPTFDLMQELGIGDQMRWMPTSMGYFFEGKLSEWGTPVALLKFPGLTLIEKFRYGLMMFLATRRKAAGSLENISAKTWIEAWCGRSVYQKLWRSLFDLKFYQYADPVSAAWIWTRIKRVGTSRRSIMQEELGYIEGGSETLIARLVQAIETGGGKIRLRAPVGKVLTEQGRVRGVVVAGEEIACDAAILTVPTPLIPEMVPDLPDRQRYADILNIGVACLIFKLRKQVTPHFWVNVVDPEMGIPGFVEFSNLRPTGDTIVYVPYYMPVDQPNWARADDDLLNEAFSYLKRVNPALTDSDRIDARVGRLRHAQPVCPPGFASRIPPVQTQVKGLQIADTCFYYPEDRGISESVRYGRLMAQSIEASIEGQKGAL